MTKMKRCPVCGSPVKPENLPRHLKKVHPEEDAESRISKAEKKARRGVSRREGAVFAGIAVAIVIIVILAIVYQGPPRDLVGEEAPAFTIYDVIGERPYTLPSGDFYNEVVFLEFFSPTCGYCIQFIPTMQQLYQDYYVTRGEVYFISINTNPDNDSKELVDFAASHGSDWIHALDTDNIADDYGVRGTPHLFIIDLKKNPSEAIVEYDHPGIATGSEISVILDELLA
jgi:thiol-disulfide isomerase/thioredoxin